MSLLRPTEPLKNPLLLPPLTLAYVGDSVHDLYVRLHMVEQDHVRVGDLHRETVRRVRARAQAGSLAALHATLSEEEQDVVRRGRNAKGRAAPKGSDAAEYAASTAFETLVGFLFLAGREERLRELLDASLRFVPAKETGRS